MDLDAMTAVLDAAGIEYRARGGRRNLNISCVFAPWKSPPHESGEDNRPSLSIKIDPFGPSYYTCYACDSKGALAGMLRWLAFYRGLGHGLDKAIEMAQQAEVRCQAKSRPVIEPPTDAEREEWQRRFELFRADIKSMIGVVPHYAIDRGLTVETCKAWYLGFDKRRQRLVFPVRDEEGKFAGAVGRTLKGEDDMKYYAYGGYTEDEDDPIAQKMPPMFEKGKHLYGAHVVAPVVRAAVAARDWVSARVFLMEGSLDVCMSWQNGVRWAVGIMGRSFTEEQCRLLLSWGTQTVYVGLDGDGSGEKGAERVITMLRGRVLMKVVKFPPKMDPGDFHAGSPRMEQHFEGMTPDKAFEKAMSGARVVA